VSKFTTALVSICATIIASVLADCAYAEPMSFRIETTDLTCASCTTIVATGDIAPTSSQELSDLLHTAAVPTGATVIFDSPGGSLIAGIEIGELVRRQRLHSSVAPLGVCASACVYAFLGGVHRTAEASARIGLHQFSSNLTPADAVADTQRILSYLTGHVRESGASMRVLEIASSIPPDQVLWLSGEELYSLRITTARGSRRSPAWTFDRHPSLFESSIQSEVLLSDGRVADLLIRCPLFRQGPPDLSQLYVMQLTLHPADQVPLRVLSALTRLNRSSVSVQGSQALNILAQSSGSFTEFDAPVLVPCSTSPARRCGAVVPVRWITLTAKFSSAELQELAGAVREGATVTWSFADPDLPLLAVVLPARGVSDAIGDMLTACETGRALH
jgi:hypothetical protein